MGNRHAGEDLPAAVAEVAGDDPTTDTYRYHLTDHLGSVRGIVDGGSKAWLGRNEFTPYGAQRTSAGLPLNKGFTGHTWDPAVGQYFAQFRYYNPGSARWHMRDPLGYVDGQNLFGYVKGHAISAIDRMGLLSQRICDQIRGWLDSERDLGTWSTVVVISTFGVFAGGPGAGDFDNAPTKTDKGVIDLHYWIDIMALGGWAPSYYILRFGGNLVEKDPDRPFEDPNERRAVEAIYNDTDTFRELFPPDFMKRECGDDPARY